MNQWVRLIEIFKEMEERMEREHEQTQREELETLETELNLDAFMADFYSQQKKQEQPKGHKPAER